MCVYVYTYVCVYVLVTQSRPTLCDPMDCSPPGSPVHGILQARILEWVAFPFCRGSSWPRDRKPGSPALLADSSPSEPPGKPNFCLFNRKDVNLYNSCCFWGCNELKTFEQQSGNVNQYNPFRKPFHKIYQNTKHSFSKSFYFWKWILNEILHIERKLIMQRY